MAGLKQSRTHWLETDNRSLPNLFNLLPNYVEPKNMRKITPKIPLAPMLSQEFTMSIIRRYQRRKLNKNISQTPHDIYCTFEVK